MFGIMLGIAGVMIKKDVLKYDEILSGWIFKYRAEQEYG
jgi:hypothetical protein